MHNNLSQTSVKRPVGEMLQGHSLVLYHDNVIAYSSDHSGIRPLFSCVSEIRDILDTREFMLCDKVIGLAAARLIIHCRSIRSVNTLIASKAAMELLKSEGIALHADIVVENILNKDKTRLCPMEERALHAVDNKSFYDDLERLFSR